MNGKSKPAEISDEEKTLYQQKIKAYQGKMDAIKIKEKNLLLMVQDYSEEAPIAHLALADEMLNLTLCYLGIDTASKAFLNARNEEVLNEGRKAIYKSLVYMETVVTGVVDAPFSDYADNLEKIASFDASQRFNLVERMGKTVTLLKNAYGDNTKWKWAFVELDGRYAAAAKNILDLKNVISNTDPESPYYEHTVLHLQKVKELLNRAADRYREKYEMASGQVEDFKKGINFLRSLFRIHALTGDKNNAAAIKKKHEIWTTKLENDIKTKKARNV